MPESGHRGVTSGLTSEAHEVSRSAFCLFYPAMNILVLSPHSLTHTAVLSEPRKWYNATYGAFIRNR